MPGLKGWKRFFFNMHNIFKIWGELVKDVIKRKNRAKDCLPSFFIYKFL